MVARAHGLTLLELLVALVIAALLLCVGLPEWGRRNADHVLADRADALLHTLNRARSEAVKRGRRVDVCPADGADCRGLAAPWDGGWKIVVPALDAGDAATFLAAEPGGEPGVSIRGNRPVADYVSFNSLGMARRADGALQMGTFVICRQGHRMRKVIVASSGRVRAEHAPEMCP